MAYARDLVARVKGALRAGLRPKQIAHLTEIPVETIKDWVDDVRADVPADEKVADEIRAVLLGRFNGRLSTR